ncbi:MAG: gluconate 2-dehydrogenase subunit 3 family protein [Bacteroidota bacterium]
MKRRKALFGIAILGGGVISYSGYSAFKLFSLPDFAFLENKNNLINQLAEIIIPTTDTPGAKEANVSDFIIHTILNNSDTGTQNNFIRGLKELSNYTIENYKCDFENCDESSKTEILRYFEKNSRSYSGLIGKIYTKVFGKSFFEALKEYTTIGYCTSEVGAKLGLEYVHIPTRYSGCHSIDAGQKCWVTK